MRLYAKWRGLLCYIGLVKHAYQHREQFFLGRRKQSTATRRADPPGWGYVLEWLECSDCRRTMLISARECWVWDYVPGAEAAAPVSAAARGGFGE